MIQELVMEFRKAAGFLLFLLSENSMSAIVLPLVPRLKPSLQSDARHFFFKACFLLSVQIQNEPEKQRHTHTHTGRNATLSIIRSDTDKYMEQIFCNYTVGLLTVLSPWQQGMCR